MRGGEARCGAGSIVSPPPTPCRVYFVNDLNELAFRLAAAFRHALLSVERTDCAKMLILLTSA